ERPRMELAEGPEDVLRPELDRARATGVVPGWPACLDLQLVHRRAARFQNRERIGLGLENVHRRGIARPVAALALHPRGTAADAGCSQPLILRSVAFIGAGDLEQRHV